MKIFCVRYESQADASVSREHVYQFFMPISKMLKRNHVVSDISKLKFKMILKFSVIEKLLGFVIKFART